MPARESATCAYVNGHDWVDAYDSFGRISGYRRCDRCGVFRKTEDCEATTTPTANTEEKPT